MRLFPVLLVLVFQAGPQPSKGSLEGTVVRADSGAPIPGAQITLVKFSESPAANPYANDLLSVTGDTRGHFSIPELAAGSYRLFAVRNGFARGEYGQRKASGRGTPLTIGEGQQLKDLSLRLIPAATVTGRITGPGGDPLTGFTVELVRATYDSTGQKVLRPSITARTDDRGEYRLFWITPGKYYVRVNTQTHLDDEQMQLSRQILLEAGRPGGAPPNGLEMAGFINMNQVFSRDGYVMTYYPNATDRAGAQLLDIVPGTELGGINLQLVQQPMARIRGRVVTAAGQPAREGSVTLQSREDVRFRGEVRADSNFEINNVTPGFYFLGASTVGGWAGTELQVSGSNIDNVILTTRPGVAVSGRVRLDGGGLPSEVAGWGRVCVLLDQTDGLDRGCDSSAGRIRADGTFSIAEVFPEPYWVRLDNQPPNIYLKEARSAGTDLLQTPLLVSGSETVSLELVISTKTARLEGMVIDQRQQPVASVQVIVIPDQPRTRRELYRTTATSSSGHFVIDELVPGDYKVFAWEDIEPYSYFDPEVLKPYEQAGTAIHVGESSLVNANARLIPSP